MAYTLADYARVEDDPLKAGVIDIFRRESFIMEYLNWVDTDTLALSILRTKTLPSVAFRKIGAAFTESKGVVEQVSERVFDLGGYIDVDKLLVKAKSVVDQRALQTDMFVTSFSYSFNDYFINGDPTVDVDGFIGLWYRTINLLPAASHYNATIDISPDASGLAANFDTFLDGLQTTMHRIDGHKPDLLVMNATLYLRLLSAIRTKGLFATTEDSYGRTVATYGPGGPKIIDLGPKADQTTEIIGDVETTNGLSLTTGTATSLYAIRLGEKYLQGIQLYALDTEDRGLIDDGRTYRTVVDWPVGIFAAHNRYLCRYSGIVAA